jgi:hypothetical protein
MSINPSTGLTRAQQVGIWTGVSGAALGCSAWVLAMAAMGHDWMAFALTLALDAVLVIVFAKLCLRHGSRRLLLLAALVVILTAHCVSIYWWRFDLWRNSALITPEALHREKLAVTFTITGMVVLLLLQIGVFYWLQSRAKRPR